MLTATYTLVALAVEQASIRVSLQAFQQYLESNFMHQSALTAGQVDYACASLERLYGTCHWRKIEMFLIPAIRGATDTADPLLRQLDALNLAAADVVGAVTGPLAGAALESESQVKRFCGAIDAFCSALLTRIDIEEKELFPVARSVISGEAWFAIANDMLVHDARRQDSRAGAASKPRCRTAANDVAEVTIEPPPKRLRVGGVH